MRLLCVLLFSSLIACSLGASFSGQYVDLLFGHVIQNPVELRAPRYIQLINSTTASIIGTDDGGVTWWGPIFGKLAPNGTAMSVDFSPKGGPSSVDCQLTPAGGIMWTGKNYWERTSSTPSFGGEFENVFAGDVPPSIGKFESVHLHVLNNWADGTATAKIHAQKSWGNTYVTGKIVLNQMTADFSSVGGPASAVANLTESGNIQWLSENVWERVSQ